MPSDFAPSVLNPASVAAAGSGHRSALPLPPAPAACTERPAHLVLPFAAASDPACQALLPQLPLPHLSAWLATSHPAQWWVGQGESLAMPHEQVLARVLGLWPAAAPADADLPTPWAAWSAAQSNSPTGQPGEPAAWFSPCHQQVGTGQVSLQHPDELGLSEAHSLALLAALQPLAQEDGLQLQWHSPTHWLARGPSLGELATASLDRVAGRSIAPWLPMAAHAAPLRRLQSEAQMLFYTHPAHDERVAQGLAPVNALWISGSGACPPTARAKAPELRWCEHLRQPALSSDWRTWQQAWAQLDAELLPAWLAHAAQGHPTALTLCGEFSSVTLLQQPRPWWPGLQHKISSLLRPNRISDILLTL